MSSIKACIFDLDGVIVDTARFHYLAWKRLGEELGITITEEQNEQLKGISRQKSLEIILEMGGKVLADKEFQQAMDKKNRWFLEYIHQMTPDDVLPGVDEFMQDLQKANIKKALGSASKNAPTILEQIGMDKKFDAIIDGNQVVNPKPHPEIFLKGAKALETPPENCVVFEDAIAGIEAAKAGGMYCIGVGEPNTLQKADFVIRGFEEMNLDRLKF